MRKNNKQNPFPLRKYYGAMIIGFVFFLGIMAYYSATFRQRRDQAKQEVRLEEESIGANNSATQEKTKTTTQDKRETETTAQMKRTMSESVTYNGTSKLTWPIKGNIILPYSVNSTIYFESLDQYRINKGILIEAKEGEGVKAVRKAKVREIKKSAEYGQSGIDGYLRPIYRIIRTAGRYQSKRRNNGQCRRSYCKSRRANKLLHIRRNESLFSDGKR